MGSGSAGGGGGEGRAHERRETARGHADDDIAVADSSPDDTRRGRAIVLRALLRAEHGAAPSRHDGLHQAWRRAERRRTLGGFEHAEPSARARADEDEAPASAERGNDQVHGPRDPGRLASDRGDGAPVKTLADVIAFNTANAERTMPYFQQEILVRAEARGGLDTPEYREALKGMLDGSRAQGIDADAMRLIGLALTRSAWASAAERSRTRRFPAAPGRWPTSRPRW